MKARSKRRDPSNEEVAAVVLGLSPLQRDFTPDVDGMALDPIPYLVYLSTEINEKGIGYLLKKGKEADARWQHINYDQRNAVLNLAYQLIQAMQFEIIGADDADPDPSLDKSKIVVYAPGDSGAPAGLPPGDYIVQYHPKDASVHPSFLNGAFTPTTPGTNNDLTTLGPIDWHHFGSDESSKSIGTLGISHVSINGGQYFSNGDVSPIPFTFSWSDAPGSASGVSSGAVAYHDAATLTFSLNLAAATAYVFVIWVSAYNSTLGFNVNMANNAAPAYNDSSLVASGGSHAGYYTINCRSATATTLNVTLHGGNVQLFAIAGAPGSAPPLPAGTTILSLTGLNDTPVLSVNGGLHAIDRPGGYDLQRVAPVPDVHVSLNGVDGTIIDSIPAGATQPQRNIALGYTPPATPKTPPQPCNCDTGGSKPPPTPPTPPTPPPGIPVPTPPSKQTWSCIALIDDAGIGVSVSLPGVSGVSVTAKYYEQNNTPIGAAITTALAAELVPPLQAGDVVLTLDMRCTAIMQISPFTLFGLSDPLITRPTIVKISGSDSVDYYYFQRAKTETILPGPLVHDVYDGHAEIVNAVDGYTDWAFNCAYIECEIARSPTNLLLQLCGALVRYWQPIFDFPFDGSEKVLADGMHDIYEHYAIPFDVHSFLTSDGYPVNTDQVHGFVINITPLNAAPLRSAATTAIISGHIKATAGAGDTTFYLQIVGDGSPVANSAPMFLGHTDDKDFSFTITGTFNAGTVYGFRLVSDAYPAEIYYLTNVRGAFT